MGRHRTHGSLCHGRIIDQQNPVLVLVSPVCILNALPRPPLIPIRRIIIRGGKAAADQDLMGQLGFISKVEHSTSAVEVQLPKLGEEGGAGWPLSPLHWGAGLRTGLEGPTQLR